MSIIKDRHLGRFTVQIDFINEEPAGVRSVLNNVIVLRTEFEPWNDSVEYFGICDAFEALPEGAVVPTYVALLRKEDDGTVTLVKWERR